MFDQNGDPLKNPYTVLGIEPFASDDDITKAFKKLMLKLHPDKQPAGLSEDEVNSISQKFHDVMDAKSILLDGEYLAARRAFDSKLKAQQQAAVVQQQQSFSQPTQNGQHGQNTQQSRSREKTGKSESSNTGGSNFNNRPTTRKSEVKHKVWGKASHRSRRASTACHVRETKEKRNSEKPERRHSDNGDNCSTTSTDDSSSEEDMGPNNLGSKAEVSSSNRRKVPNKGKKGKGEPNQPNHASRGSTTASRRQRGGSDAVNEINRRKSPHKARENPHSRSCNSFLDGKDEAGKKSNNTSTGVRPHSTRKFSMDTYGAKSPPSSRKQRMSCAILGGHDPPKPPLFSKDNMPDQAPQAPSATTIKGVHDAKQRISNSINLLSKSQFHCPLTKEIINEPMTDFEGNNYERAAILKYLESHIKSPVTGSPLYPCYLTPNSALKERIKYTLKLKDCLESFVQNDISAPEQPPQPPSTLHPLPNINNRSTREPRKDKDSSNPKKEKHEITAPFTGHPNNNSTNTSSTPGSNTSKSLRNFINTFIRDLNSNSPSITLTELDTLGITSFSYLGIKVILEAIDIANTLILQTNFDQNKRSANITSRILEWNRALQEIGLGGKLSFRSSGSAGNVKGSTGSKGNFAFQLTKDIELDKVNKREVRHSMEYFLEMSIKLHNILYVNDQKRFDKVRLCNG